MRFELAEYYKLKDIKTDDGVTITAYEQAKKLPLRIAFGGGVEQWKTDFNVQTLGDHPIITKMMSELRRIKNEIYSVNPHIVQDLLKEKKGLKKKMKRQRNEVSWGFIYKLGNALFKKNVLRIL